MAQRTQRPDVIIIGAGIIGLSVAWQACRRGLAVTVLERGEAGRGTSHVAAGMLAPVAEAEFGEDGRRLSRPLPRCRPSPACDRREP